MRTTKLKWFHSVITQAVLISAFIILCGYLVSLSITIQGFQTVSRVAYDPEIESLLDEHLSSIKQIYDLRQQVFLVNLQRVMPPSYRLAKRRTLTEASLLEWLRLARFDEFTDLAGIELKRIEPDDLNEMIRSKVEPLAWLNRSQLRVYEFLVEIPKGPIHAQFRRAEALKQRYQLVSAAWDEQIKPTFLKSNALILIAIFLVLTTSLIVMARRFHRRVGQMVEGFYRWSDGNDEFRYKPEQWAGELGVITQQFNSMADMVAENKKRSVYLEKIASWQVIARKLAHEIKNPLTPIQMMVSQLKKRYQGDDATYVKLLDDAHNIISEEVAGLRRMVDNFSQFARLPEAKPDRCDLVKIIYNVVELEKVAFERHRITFITGLDQAPAWVDEHLIRQVLLNLIKNAGEACGETASDISVRLIERSATFRIVVEDNGPGIPDELQSRIFEAYFTTKHTGPSPGMGLGLAICQKVILDHGGEMSLISRPGLTQFVIELPKIRTNEEL